MVSALPIITLSTSSIYIFLRISSLSSQIEDCEKKGLTMMDAIDEELFHEAFKIIKKTKISHGAIAMERL